MRKYYFITAYREHMSRVHKMFLLLFFPFIFPFVFAFWSIGWLFYWIATTKRKNNKANIHF
jgi:hypothetical protein